MDEDKDKLHRISALRCATLLLLLRVCGGGAVTPPRCARRAVTTVSRATARGAQKSNRTNHCVVATAEAA